MWCQWQRVIILTRGEGYQYLPMAMTLIRVKGYQHVVSMAKGNNTNQRRGVPIISNGNDTYQRVKGYQHVVSMAKGNNTNQRRGVPILSNGNDTYQRVKGYQHVVPMAKGNNANQRRGVPILSNSNDTYQSKKDTNMCQWQRVIILTRGEGYQYFPMAKDTCYWKKTLMFATGKDQNNSNQQCKFPKTCC